MVQLKCTTTGIYFHHFVNCLQMLEIRTIIWIKEQSFDLTEITLETYICVFAFTKNYLFYICLRSWDYKHLLLTKSGSIVSNMFQNVMLLLINIKLLLPSSVHVYLIWTYIILR